MRTYHLDQGISLPEQLKSAFIILDRSGFFKDGLLVGSWAFVFYREIFDIEYVLRTDDVDFAFGQDVLNREGGTDLEAAFLAKGYSAVMDNLTGLQKFLSGTFGIDFLIHRKGGREKIVTVNRYNVHAQPLPFLDLLFISPLEVQLPDYNVRIPSPESLFLHKLIIAQRRKKESKKGKDLEQCLTLAPHLDAGSLADVALRYRMSRATIQSIRKSCAAIDIPADFL